MFNIFFFQNITNQADRNEETVEIPPINITIEALRIIIYTTSMNPVNVSNLQFKACAEPGITPPKRVYTPTILVIFHLQNTDIISLK